MPSEPLPSENLASQQFRLLTREYRRVHGFEHHVVIPLKTFGTLVFHSNLSLWMFQHSCRGNPLTEVLRWVCFIIHALSFTLGLLFVFLRADLRYKMIFGVAIPLYILYLTYFQRGIEERYTLPFLALVILSTLFFLRSVIVRIRSPKK
jgi:hypothetical protein